MNSFVLIAGFIAVLASSALAQQASYRYVQPQRSNQYQQSNNDNEADYLTERQIENNLRSICHQATDDNVIKFLSTLNSTDGRVILRSIGLNPDIIAEHLRLIRDDQSEIAYARDTLRNIFSSIQSMSSRYSLMRQLYKVHINYLQKQMAIQAIRGSSLDALKAGLTALAAAQNWYWFGPVNFAELLNTLYSNQDGGQQQVTDAFVRWIETTDYVRLQRAGLVYTAATRHFSSSTSNISPGAGTGNNSTTGNNATTTTQMPPLNQTQSSNITTTTQIPPSNFSSTTQAPFNSSTTSRPLNMTTSRPSNVTSTQGPSSNETKWLNLYSNATTPGPLNISTTSLRPYSSTNNVSSQYNTTTPRPSNMTTTTYRPYNALSQNATTFRPSNMTTTTYRPYSSTNNALSQNATTLRPSNMTTTTYRPYSSTTSYPKSVNSTTTFRPLNQTTTSRPGNGTGSGSTTPLFWP